jgi:hypothetical protein
VPNDGRNLRSVSKLTLIVSRHVSYSENEILPDAGNWFHCSPKENI